MPSPASAIRSGFSICLRDADLEVEAASARRSCRDRRSTQLRFDEPGAVLITEKDAVKCEHLQTGRCVVRRGRSSVRRR